MEKFKIGIIGCGGIANGKHLPALKSQSDQAEMVAFCDLIPERAEEAKKDYGTPDARVYTDYREMLEKEKDIDIVHVLTPNRSHSEISCAALDAGKHVMCEKPMAINSAEALKMIEAAKRNNRKLSIGYQNRNRPESLFLKAEADAGTFGDIYYAKATALRRRAVPVWGVFLNEYEQGGGPLIDIGTHALDLTLWVMNNYKPKYCIGTAYHKLNNNGIDTQGNEWGVWDPKDFTVEDSAFGMIVMENGATIVLESSWALNTLDVREAVTSVCGTLAGGELSRGGAKINGVRNGRQYVIEPDFTRGGPDFTKHTRGENPSNREARLWLKAIREDTDPLVTPEQAFTVTRILEGIYESSKTGTIYNF